MKAQELRIGNLIQTEDGLIETVGGYRIEKLEFHNGSDFYTGIRLSEEWLTRIKGLKKFNATQSTQLRTVLNPDDSISVVQFGHGGYPVGVCIHYLHDLQNRYFSLTGEELQIQLP